MEIYVVQKGDTIWSIAQRFGVSPQRIISDNGIMNPQSLVECQALVVLIPEITYVIRAGDTLNGIADKFGVTAMEILQNNPSLASSPSLWAGQPIVIKFQGEKNRDIVVNGYAYPYIQRELLERTLPFLSTLTLFGYGFTMEGELIPINDQPLIDLAYRFQTAPIMLLSSITEDGNFDGQRASRLFQDIPFQEKILSDVIATMKQKGYLGLDVDFEYIAPEDADAFLSFLRRTAEMMHAEGFFINTDLAPKTSADQKGLLYEAHNYRQIGEISDTVLLMTYEWGYTYGPPMAVAPLNHVENVVSYAVTEIPPEKIMLGLPNYGYDWILPYERGITRATSIGNQYAVEVAAKNHVDIQFDETAQSPYFEYWGRDGNKHVVWFEDARSMQSKFNLIDRFGLLGGGYWNIMKPFYQNWDLLNSRYRIRKYP